MKMHYPGSTSKHPPAAVVKDIALVDERDPDRINVHYAGKRGGTYMTSLSLESAVDLIIALEQQVTRVASKTGYTDPEFRRLAAHRAKRQGP